MWALVWDNMVQSYLNKTTLHDQSLATSGGSFGQDQSAGVGHVYNHHHRRPLKPPPSIQKYVF